MQGGVKRFILTLMLSLSLSLFVVFCYFTWPIGTHVQPETTFLEAETSSMASLQHGVEVPNNVGLFDDLSSSSFFSQEQPKGVSRIFFLETGGRGELSARQACAVESAARLHPSWTVHLLSVPNKHGSRENAENPFARVLQAIPNVVMKEIKPEEAFRGTPLEPWYESGALIKSAYPVEHLADALRLAETFHRGGIYLDMDVVVLRSLASLTLPFVSQSPTNNGDMVSNAFLGFQAGHPFLLALMQRASHVYKPKEWASIGPELLRLEVLARCGVRNISAVVGQRWGGTDAFMVLPHHLFLCVHYTQWRLFFKSSTSHETWSRCGQSYVMHVFNKMSSQEPAVSGCAYRQAAKKYCPESLQQSLTLAGSF